MKINVSTISAEGGCEVLLATTEEKLLESLKKRFQEWGYVSISDSISIIKSFSKITTIDDFKKFINEKVNSGIVIKHFCREVLNETKVNQTSCVKKFLPASHDTLKCDHKNCSGEMKLIETAQSGTFYDLPENHPDYDKPIGRWACTKCASDYWDDFKYVVMGYIANV